VPPPNTVKATAAGPLRPMNTPFPGQSGDSNRQGQLPTQLCTNTVDCQGRLELGPEGPAPPAVLAHGGREPYPGPPFAGPQVVVRQVAVAEEAAAARALTTGPGLAARQSALIVGVPPPDDGLVTQVPLKVDALALAARATADLLPILHEDAVVATEGASTVLAGASGRARAAPEQPPQLADSSQDAPFKG
jgi:hypothetical protein